MASGQIRSFFDGAITWRESSVDGCAFVFEVTFLLSHPFLADLSAAGQKPPLHFHPYQTEYVQVVSGRLILEVEGHERTITAGDGQVAVMRWANHRLSHPAPIDGPDGDRTVFILSAENTAESFRLDTMFFENWYGYQHELKARHSGAMDIIQVMSMFDAGSSYLSPPRWLPFGQTFSRVLGIVLGRWIGAALGYQPYYKKWTCDWELACEKMERSFLQRRFADRAKIA